MEKMNKIGLKQFMKWSIDVHDTNIYNTYKNSVLRNENKWKIANYSM